MPCECTFIRSRRSCYESRGGDKKERGFITSIQTLTNPTVRESRTTQKNGPAWGFLILIFLNPSLSSLRTVVGGE